MKKLSRSFYLNPDVVQLAKLLIGKRLVTLIEGNMTAGIITETEAYAGTTDRASHAFGNRHTMRTSTMYRQGGTAYIYLCYGLHSLFNVVTNQNGIPHAVLIRSILPEAGIDVMMKRRKNFDLKPKLTCGPGSMSRALGITTKLNGIDLTGNIIWIEDPRGSNSSKPSIISSTRIGVDYAGTDAELPWRFLLADTEWVSHPA